MSDIETLAIMINNLYKCYKARCSDNYNGMAVYKALYPNHQIDNDKLLETLYKINQYNKLDTINIENLNIACLINLYYDNFYDILQYMYIPEVLKEENRLKYYIIKYNMVNVVVHNFYKEEAKEKNINIDHYFVDEYYIQDYQNKFEENIPVNLKARYGMEADNMIKLMIIIYYVNYGNDFEKLNDILLAFLIEYMDEMDIHGIKSWYSGKNREDYILFIEHYLNNSLKSKKVLK